MVGRGGGGVVAGSTVRIHWTERHRARDSAWAAASIARERLRIIVDSMISNQPYIFLGNLSTWLRFVGGIRYTGRRRAHSQQRRGTVASPLACP